MSAIQNIVFNAAQEARAKGYFTNEIVDNMKSKINQAFPEIRPEEVVVNVTTTPKYRLDHFDSREMIDFDVRVPIDKILALSSFYNIPDSDNRFMYPVKGQVPSEALPR